jgi:leucyl/phenylalanyl-tRNA---protein transferase
MNRDDALEVIPVPLLLKAYNHGLFPMAHEDGELYWHDPDPRAVFPLDTIEPDERTRRHLRSPSIRISVNEAFAEVIAACADREETWINNRIIASYVGLHESGHAHSVEVWKENELAGGIYGVSIGGAFFGESMFNNRNNMAKVAFHALVDRLKKKGFTLFDTQYLNPFTQELGAIEIPRDEYRRTLGRALALPMKFP